MNDKRRYVKQTGPVVTVNSFDYQLDDGESLGSVTVGQVLDYLRPHGGPFRVLENDGSTVVLERLNAR